MLSVEEAITGRRSIRAFLPKPVPREIIQKVLLIAGRAPSGTNIQPWKVWVLDGKVRDEVVREMRAGHDAGDNGHREYHYDLQQWREPYLARRRACGFGLYNTIGIPRGDKERMRDQQGRNYQFFDAPVGLIFSIDRDLEIGSWVDYGMFLQSIMVAARAFGLETCPQAALCSRHELLQKRLGIPAEQMVLCGMALGYADPDAIVNTFVTERMALEEFVTFVEEVQGE
jgi:nitroreductase